MKNEDLFKSNEHSPAEAALEKAVEVVREKAWSLNDAFKCVAKFLVGYGAASPSIIGYTSVATEEAGYKRVLTEDEKALQEADLRTSALKDRPTSDGTEESSLVFHQCEEEGDIDHAFVSKDGSERKSLVSGRSWDEIDQDRQEHDD